MSGQQVARCPRCGEPSSLPGEVVWCPCVGWLDEGGAAGKAEAELTRLAALEAEHEAEGGKA